MESRAWHCGRFASAAGTLALVGGSLFVVGATPAGATAGGAVSSAGVEIHPMVTSRLASTTQPPTSAQCQAAIGLPCYDPAQIQAAYDEQPLFSAGVDGAGQSIVIVDAFGSPTIAADLHQFDATFGLADPPSLQVIAPAGAIPPYTPTSDRYSWASETTRAAPRRRWRAHRARHRVERHQQRCGQQLLLR